MYSTFKNVSSELNPKLLDNLFSASEAGGLIYGMATGNYSLIQKIVGLTGAKQLADELLTNPKAKQLLSKMMQSADRGKWATANSMLGELTKEIAKTNFESALYLMGFDFYDLAPKKQEKKKELNLEEFEKLSII